MPMRIHETIAAPLIEAPVAATPGRVRIEVISPGWGSSGFYSAKVLDNAVTEKVWPAGTRASGCPRLVLNSRASAKTPPNSLGLKSVSFRKCFIA